MKFLCSTFGHSRASGRIRHDGMDFRSKCKRCDAPLIRDIDGKWVPTDSDLGADGK